MIDTAYTHRFLARFVMEAETPLAVGSGVGDMNTDALVAKDVNGLPYIPGTSLSGIIRHALGEEKTKNFFGYQMSGKSNEGKGSDIIFTEAKMIGKEGKVIDGLTDINWSDDFYVHFVDLPIRQHARINEKGVTVDTGKFDEQVVYKGTRFCFELEMVADDKDESWSNFESVIQQLSSNTFRVGSGTRTGFGKMEIVPCKCRDLDLCKPEDLKFYENKSSDLSKDWDGNKEVKITKTSENWIAYHLSLIPEDFFLFGSGFGDDEADMTPVREEYITWNDNEPHFENNAILIPAASLKGALAHRVAYHYNKLDNVFADEIDKDDYIKHIGKNNIAVKFLFGSEGERADGKMVDQKRGNVLFSDIIENKNTIDKIVNHVSIDRFTGGAIDGALFTEKTIYGKNQEFDTYIYVNKTAFHDEKIKAAFENTLKDLCTGLLPLGGGVNRGNGTFTGNFTIAEEGERL